VICFALHYLIYYVQQDCQIYCVAMHFWKHCEHFQEFQICSWLGYLIHFSLDYEMHCVQDFPIHCDVDCHAGCCDMIQLDFQHF
jgi:hypothetical protein